MLGCSHHAIGLGPANKGGYQVRNRIRILAKRPRIDDRIARVAVHVRDWEEVPVNTDCARLLRGNRAELLSVGHVTSRPKRHGIGKRESRCNWLAMEATSRGGFLSRNAPSTCTVSVTEPT